MIFKMDFKVNGLDATIFTDDYDEREIKDNYHFDNLARDLYQYKSKYGIVTDELGNKFFIIMNGSKYTVSRNVIKH